MKKNDLAHWDIRFLGLAEYIAGWSKDPSTKVGAVITDAKNRIVSIGFNGLPRGIEDTPQRLEDRDLKYKMVVHAERNAILFANQSLEGCVLYTWPLLPCSVCSAMIVQSGIAKVVSPNELPDRWAEDFSIAVEMLEEASVELVLFDP